MEIRLPPEIEQSILAAFNAGDFERVANQLAEAVLKSNPVIIGTDIADIQENVDIEGLAQHVAPFDATAKIDVDCWPADESTNEFLTFVDTHRNETVVPTVKQ
ncbi:hypothetical protein N9L06_01890 [Mariniblastus sp.]|nr:hypothetical protein [Mariniblastus sp.]